MGLAIRESVRTHYGITETSKHINFPVTADICIGHQIQIEKQI